jgi:integrase/recombinase XerC
MEADTGAKSINRKISSLRSFYKFLQREGLVDKNPMAQVQAPKIPKRLPVIVEEAKLNTLLDDEALFSSGFEGLRDRVVLELLYGTGIRLAELLGLKNSDIDDYNQQIKVLGKRNKERIIPLAKPLYALLKVYIDQKNELGFTSTDKLIVTDKGTAAYPQLIYRLVKQALGEVSTQDKKSPHILRHSFATALLNKGAELTAIKELLGHANLSATQVYTHNSIEKLKSIYKQAHPKA